jgi:methyl-accepting chemotaxis protein
VQEQSQVTADIDRNVLSIKTLADDSSQGSHAVQGINQLVRQLSDLDRLVRQFQQQPVPHQFDNPRPSGQVVLAR